MSEPAGEMVDRVSSFLARQPTKSAKPVDIQRAVGGDLSEIVRVLDELVREGKAEKVGSYYRLLTEPASGEATNPSEGVVLPANGALRFLFAMIRRLNDKGLVNFIPEGDRTNVYWVDGGRVMFGALSIQQRAPAGFAIALPEQIKVTQYRKLLGVHPHVQPGSTPDVPLVGLVFPRGVLPEDWMFVKVGRDTIEYVTYSEDMGEYDWNRMVEFHHTPCLEAPPMVISTGELAGIISALKIAKRKGLALAVFDPKSGQIVATDSDGTKVVRVGSFSPTKGELTAISLRYLLPLFEEAKAEGATVELHFLEEEFERVCFTIRHNDGSTVKFAVAPFVIEGGVVEYYRAHHRLPETSEELSVKQDRTKERVEQQDGGTGEHEDVETIGGFKVPKFPLELAERGWSMISQFPEKQAKGDEKWYHEALLQVMPTIVSAPLTPEEQQKLVWDYASKWLEKYKELASTRAGVASPMVVGPANFPYSKRMEQRIAKVERLERELLNFPGEWKKWFQKYLERKKVKEVGRAGVLQEQIAKLRAELEKRKRWHEIMKQANRIVRSKRLSNEEKMKRLEEIGVEEVGEYPFNFPEPDYMGVYGFPKWALDNNRQHIKRLEERIKELERRAEEAKAAEATGNVQVVEEHPEWKVIKNFEDNRVWVVFPGVPPEEVRTALKQSGFRWSPRRKAWVRKLTGGAVDDALRILYEHLPPKEAIEKYKPLVLKAIAELRMDTVPIPAYDVRDKLKAEGHDVTIFLVDGVIKALAKDLGWERVSRYPVRYRVKLPPEVKTTSEVPKAPVKEPSKKEISGDEAWERVVRHAEELSKKAREAVNQYRTLRYEAGEILSDMMRDITPENSRKFKDMVGLTPTEWEKRIRKEMDQHRPEAEFDFNRLYCREYQHGMCGSASDVLKDMYETLVKVHFMTPQEAAEELISRLDRIYQENFGGPLEWMQRAHRAVMSLNNAAGRDVLEKLLNWLKGYARERALKCPINLKYLDRPRMDLHFWQCVATPLSAPSSELPTLNLNSLEVVTYAVQQATEAIKEWLSKVPVPDFNVKEATDEWLEEVKRFARIAPKEELAIVLMDVFGVSPKYFEEPVTDVDAFVHKVEQSLKGKLSPAQLKALPILVEAYVKRQHITRPEEVVPEETPRKVDEFLKEVEQKERELEELRREVEALKMPEKEREKLKIAIQRLEQDFETAKRTEDKEWFHNLIKRYYEPLVEEVQEYKKHMELLERIKEAVKKEPEKWLQYLIEEGKPTAKGRIIFLNQFGAGSDFWNNEVVQREMKALIEELSKKKKPAPQEKPKETPEEKVKRLVEQIKPYLEPAYKVWAEDMNIHYDSPYHTGTLSGVQNLKDKSQIRKLMDDITDVIRDVQYVLTNYPSLRRVYGMTKDVLKNENLVKPYTNIVFDQQPVKDYFEAGSSNIRGRGIKFWWYSPELSRQYISKVMPPAEGTPPGVVAHEIEHTLGSKKEFTDPLAKVVAIRFYLKHPEYSTPEWVCMEIWEIAKRALTEPKQYNIDALKLVYQVNPKFVRECLKGRLAEVDYKKVMSQIGAIPKKPAPQKREQRIRENKPAPAPKPTPKPEPKSSVELMLNRVRELVDAGDIKGAIIALEEILERIQAQARGRASVPEPYDVVVGKLKSAFMAELRKVGVPAREEDFNIYVPPNYVDQLVRDVLEGRIQQVDAVEEIIRYADEIAEELKGTMPEVRVENRPKKRIVSGEEIFKKKKPVEVAPQSGVPAWLERALDDPEEVAGILINGAHKWIVEKSHKHATAQGYEEYVMSHVEALVDNAKARIDRSTWAGAFTVAVLHYTGGHLVRGGLTEAYKNWGWISAWLKENAGRGDPYSMGVLKLLRRNARICYKLGRARLATVRCKQDEVFIDTAQALLLIPVVKVLGAAFGVGAEALPQPYRSMYQALVAGLKEVWAR